jgi:hypothetical protein
MIKSLADRLRRIIRLVSERERQVSSSRYNHAFCFGIQLEPRNVGLRVQAECLGLSHAEGRQRSVGAQAPFGLVSV